MASDLYTPPKRRRPSRGRMVFVPAVALAVAVFVLDRALKLLVERSMPLNSSVEVIPDFFSLTYIVNSGGAGGILGGSPVLLLIGSVVAVVVVLWMLLSGPTSRSMTLGCGLILGGAAGNLYDRATSGEVTDYIHFSFWYVFNAADTAIVCGVGLLLISVFFSPKTR